MVCDIVDVGPWNTDDPYWTIGSRPQAESGVDRRGRPTNLAGIDLTPAAARAIGIDGKGKVDWEFSGASEIVNGGKNMGAPANDIVTVLQQALAFFQAVQNPQQPAQPQTPSQTPPQTQPATQPADLQKVIQLITGILNPSAAGAAKPMGQVNGAPGDTIGNLLDGKKTAIGTIGALVTSLLSFATTAAPSGVAGAATSLSGLGQVLAPLIPAAGLSGFAMPVFLALAAWGVLGKLEKWSGNSNPASPPK